MCKMCYNEQKLILRGFIMRAVVTVVGKDMVGILAGVSNLCAERNINVAEVSQTVLQDMFCMIMLVDLEKADKPFSDFTAALDDLAASRGLQIHAMHEDVFNSMHHV